MNSKNASIKNAIAMYEFAHDIADVSVDAIEHKMKIVDAVDREIVINDRGIIENSKAGIKKGNGRAYVDVYTGYEKITAPNYLLMASFGNAYGSATNNKEAIRVYSELSSRIYEAEEGMIQTIVCNHKNGNIYDNSYENIEYTTAGNNYLHAAFMFSLHHHFGGRYIEIYKTPNGDRHYRFKDNNKVSAIELARVIDNLGIKVSKRYTEKMEPWSKDILYGLLEYIDLEFDVWGWL